MALVRERCIKEIGRVPNAEPRLRNFLFSLHRTDHFTAEIAFSKSVTRLNRKTSKRKAKSKTPSFTEGVFLVYYALNYGRKNLQTRKGDNRPKGA